MKAPTIAEAWAGGRNNFNLTRLVAAWQQRKGVRSHLPLASTPAG